MATALNLRQAAGQAADNLQVLWISNALKAQLTAFWQSTIETFPDQDANGHPVANWLTVISSLADQMPATGVPYDQLSQAVDAVYRLCWMTNYLEGAGLITSAQASTGPTSILVQYNAKF